MDDKQKKLLFVGGFSLVGVAIMCVIFLSGGSGSAGSAEEDLNIDLDNDQLEAEVQEEVDPVEAALARAEREREYEREEGGEEIMFDFTDDHPQNEENLDLDENEELVNSHTTVVATTSNTPKYVPRTVHTNRRIEPEVDADEQRRLRLLGGSDVDVNTTNTGSAVEVVADQIEAIVHGQQEIKIGSRVKLRTIHEGVAGGYKIPNHTYVYGTVKSITNNRLFIDITSIKFSNKAIPVKLALHDVDDFQEGLFINSGGSEEELKNLANDANNNMRNTSLSLGPVSFSSSGTNVANRQLNKLSVVIKSGHKVLLKGTK